MVRHERPCDAVTDRSKLRDHPAPENHVELAALAALEAPQRFAVPALGVEQVAIEVCLDVAEVRDVRRGMQFPDEAFGDVSDYGLTVACDQRAENLEVLNVIPCAGRLMSRHADILWRPVLASRARIVRRNDGLRTRGFHAPRSAAAWWLRPSQKGAGQRRPMADARRSGC